MKTLFITVMSLFLCLAFNRFSYADVYLSSKSDNTQTTIDSSRDSRTKILVKALESTPNWVELNGYELLKDTVKISTPKLYLDPGMWLYLLKESLDTNGCWDKVNFSVKEKDKVVQVSCFAEFFLNELISDEEKDSASEKTNSATSHEKYKHKVNILDCDPEGFWFTGYRWETDKPYDGV